MALTAKQQLFVDEYLIDLNATQAAIRAGYSERTARKIGNENLTKPDIAKKIQEAMNNRSKRTEITADMVLKEYAKLGFSNITDYLSVEVKLVTVDRDSEGKPITELQQVVSIFETDMVPEDKMRAVAEIKQTKEGIALKLHDKKGALDSMARHLGMFVDKSEITGAGGTPLQVVFSPNMKKVGP
jgi:phage terminase small subunit